MKNQAQIHNYWVFLMFSTKKVKNENYTRKLSVFLRLLYDIVNKNIRNVIGVHGAAQSTSAASSKLPPVALTWHAGERITHEDEKQNSCSRR